MEAAHKNSRQTFQNLVTFAAVVDNDSLRIVTLVSAILVICSVVYHKHSRQKVAEYLVASALVVVLEAVAHSYILVAVAVVDNPDANGLAVEPLAISTVAAME